MEVYNLKLLATFIKAKQFEIFKLFTLSLSNGVESERPVFGACWLVCTESAF